MIRDLERTIKDIKKRGVFIIVGKVWNYMIFSRYLQPLSYPLLSRIRQFRHRRFSQLPPLIEKQLVSPQQINLISPLDYYWGDVGTVKNGDWDNNTRSGNTDLEIDYFNCTTFYKSFQRHFEQGDDWEDTAYFSGIIDEIESGTMRYGCKNTDELEYRLENLDSLYQLINEQGYKKSEDLSTNDPMEDDIRKEYLNKSYDEIKVDIDREGRYLFRDGRHRLAIAKILDIDEVPVIPMVRHYYWMVTRDLIEEYCRENHLLVGPPHPDARFGDWEHNVTNITDCIKNKIKIGRPVIILTDTIGAPISRQLAAAGYTSFSILDPDAYSITQRMYKDDQFDVFLSIDDLDPTIIESSQIIYLTTKSNKVDYINNKYHSISINIQK